MKASYTQSIKAMSRAPKEDSVVCLKVQLYFRMTPDLREGRLGGLIASESLDDDLFLFGAA
jgi:hypothetical protein